MHVFCPLDKYNAMHFKQCQALSNKHCLSLFCHIDYMFSYKMGQSFMEELLLPVTQNLRACASETCLYLIELYI